VRVVVAHRARARVAPTTIAIAARALHRRAAPSPSGEARARRRIAASASPVPKVLSHDSSMSHTRPIAAVPRARTRSRVRDARTLAVHRERAESIANPI
jgi:hypothetical protein